jgi:hypothetical protein
MNIFTYENAFFKSCSIENFGLSHNVYMHIQCILYYAIIDVTWRLTPMETPNSNIITNVKLHHQSLLLFKFIITN